TDHEPETGLVLGSGIGPLADQIQDADTFPYSDLPGFHASGVEGHAGQLVIGELAGRTVVAMQGRTHFYETGDMDPVVLPVRVMRRLGAEELLLTNAAGGIAEELAPGDLMLLSDHINKMGTNPLIGEHDDSFGERFPDLSQPYSKQLRQLARDRASEELKEGVYAAMSGPSYETPAEIRMLRTLGADAVGMSTVPEAIVANQEGMDVLGISSITNHAAGIADQPLDHDEVLEVTDQVQDRLQRLVKNIVAEL
ncbi:MAG: purine-nucleoside phosphorylase, partial [Candidatus Nanohaloarchaea archaeon]|nr:purine-nucleoside phosphorylase [Candidatus Nanohaloarchaea archaeon]